MDRCKGAVSNELTILDADFARWNKYARICVWEYITAREQIPIWSNIRYAGSTSPSSWPERRTKQTIPLRIIAVAPTKTYTHQFWHKFGTIENKTTLTFSLKSLIDSHDVRVVLDIGTRGKWSVEVGVGDWDGWGLNGSGILEYVPLDSPDYEERRRISQRDHIVAAIHKRSEGKHQRHWSTLW